jgi:hypothetical protein
VNARADINWNGPIVNLMHEDMCRGSQICQLGDVNEDKRSDIVVFTTNTASSPNDVNVALSVK